MQTRGTDPERAGGSSPDIGCHLEHRHGCDGRVEVEVVQGSPTVADPAYLRLR